MGQLQNGGWAVTRRVGRDRYRPTAKLERRRLVEYSLPREFARMQSLARPGSLIGKTITVEADYGEGITVILVPQRLGF